MAKNILPQIGVHVVVPISSMQVLGLKNGGEGKGQNDGLGTLACNWMICLSRKTQLWLHPLGWSRAWAGVGCMSGIALHASSSATHGEHKNEKPASWVPPCCVSDFSDRKTTCISPQEFTVYRC